jgi:hypothetical protein
VSLNSNMTTAGVTTGTETTNPSGTPEFTSEFRGFVLHDL